MSAYSERERELDWVVGKRERFLLCPRECETDAVRSGLTFLMSISIQQCSPGGGAQWRFLVWGEEDRAAKQEVVSHEEFPHR